MGRMAARSSGRSAKATSDAAPRETDVSRRGRGAELDARKEREVTDAAALEAAVRDAIRIHGTAFVETDLRAHGDPTRMAAIKRAIPDLVRELHSRGPNCDCPGFEVTERIAGLPLRVVPPLHGAIDSGQSDCKTRLVR